MVLEDIIQVIDTTWDVCGGCGSRKHCIEFRISGHKFCMCLNCWLSFSDQIDDKFIELHERLTEDFKYTKGDRDEEEN